MVLLGRYVDTVTGEILGFKIGGNDVYTAAVTRSKAEELKVQDIEIADYLDLEVIEAIKGRGNTYAVLSREEIYLDMYADTPYEKLDDKVALWGHVFAENALCDFDNSIAIERVKLSC